MKKAIIIITVLLTLICICACRLSQVAEPADPTQATTVPTQTQPTEPTETTIIQPDEQRIAKFQSLLSRTHQEAFMNTALLSVYETPEDVNLFDLFYNGFADEIQDPTEQELELLEGKLGEYWKEGDLIRLPVDKMDATLMELFGITFDQANGNGLENLVYLEETDCYYHVTHGASEAQLTVLYVYDVEDTIKVVYSQAYLGNFTLTLQETDAGGYRILSNVETAFLYG